eukprot:15329535-Ditylum_brightwellii.AAC.1
MKIEPRSLEFVNCLSGSRPPPILIYLPEKKEKLSPLDYQVYKPWANPKDENLAMQLLAVKYYKVGTPREWLQFIDAIFQVIKGQDVQDSKATYTLVKSLLRGISYKSSRTKKQIRREGMAQHLQSVLGL